MHIVSTRLVLLSFLLFFLVTTYFMLSYIFIYIYIFFIFLMFFFQTHASIFTKPTTMGNYIYIHCYISYSEEVKHIADDSLSIGKAG